MPSPEARPPERAPDPGQDRTLAAAPARRAGLVLIVDDVPDNLALLHDALDAAGYTVLVATDGALALLRAAQADPDIVLLDAVMPGLDGFEVARRLRAGPETAHIPIVFMTGLTETEHVLAAFEAGGVDYVTKPIRPPEVLARIAVHMHAARQARQARNALDAYGQATIALRLADGQARLVWQTPLARRWLPGYFDVAPDIVPPELRRWLEPALAGRDVRPLATVRGPCQLVATLQGRTVDDDWLVVLREVNDAATVEATMLAFGLTMRESEVLYWVAKGKTNRDIGDILGSSPATVKKHLERVYEKLGVETRTAAAAMALQRVRELAT
ncbi:MAG: response regulator transcription factor [Burkholderiales bacterium]|nr:response regulator transcription factor [Burkholderiales bacterium]MDE1927525.1 response regulator transcription factor [Burkholderiales bacterium]MDE2157539.1 response regulator transcription factor [Burkholderiales bacterium]MDE2503974.1 response regulator transcription factor [Burkholderiales bacterium]